MTFILFAVPHQNEVSLLAKTLQRPLNVLVSAVFFQGVRILKFLRSTAVHRSWNVAVLVSVLIAGTRGKAYIQNQLRGFLSIIRFLPLQILPYPLRGQGLERLYLAGRLPAPAFFLRRHRSAAGALYRQLTGFAHRNDGRIGRFPDHAPIAISLRAL